MNMDFLEVRSIDLFKVSAIFCFLAVMVACSNDDTPVGPEPERQHTAIMVLDL